jgi:hypothetical protein
MPLTALRAHPLLLGGLSYSRTLLAIALASLPATAFAQSYQPRESFAPFDMRQPANSYRSGNGLPGAPIGRTAPITRSTPSSTSMARTAPPC